MEHAKTALTASDRLKLALHLGISPRSADVVVRLYNSQMLTYDEIEGQHLSKSHRHMISRLRDVLAPQGVEINTQHGTGYWIDNVGRANLVRLLNEATEKLSPGGAGTDKGTDGGAE